MSVLIVGTHSYFVKRIIEKYHKENIDIYTLVGDHQAKRKYPHVFEQYAFKYDDENIKDIIQNINPDTVIFMGAYDTNFSWKNVKIDSMQFMAGLTNLLIACQLVGVDKFIYLSSHDVFDGSVNQYDSLDNAELNLTSYKAMAIAQGEQICERYNANGKTKTITLRLDHVYGLPEGRHDLEGFVTQNVVDAIRFNSIYGESLTYHSALHVDDAVEAIYRIYLAKAIQNQHYDVSNDTPITSLQVANIIKENLKHEVEVLDKTTPGPRNNLVFNSEIFREEFHYYTMKSYEGTLPAIIAHIENHISDYITTEEKRLLNESLKERLIRLFWNLVPYIENLIVFIPVFMINNRVVGNDIFSRLDIYFLYVLLFALSFGKTQAIISALLATLGYIFRQSYNVSTFSVLIDSSTYLWIAELFIIGMAVGHLKDNFSTLREDKDEEINYLGGQLDDIYTINASNIRVKNILEDRLINYNDSLGKIYSITSRLDKTGDGEVLFYASRVISEALATDDVAIYSIANADWCRLVSSTSEKARQLGKSLKFTNYPKMLSAFNERSIFINRELDDAYPSMASALFNDEGGLETIILLWGLPFERMTIYQANFLSVLGSMVYSSLSRSTRYLHALENQRYIKDINVLETTAFMELKNIYHTAFQDNLANYTLIKITQTGDMATIAKIVHSKLRQTDYLGLDEDHKFCILLPNCDKEEASYVEKRLTEADIACEILEAEVA